MAAEITKDQVHTTKEDAELMNLLIDSGGEINVQSTTVLIAY